MAELKVEAKFDADKCRQYLNGETTVFHCHHYSTLFAQLADDANELFDGVKHLKDAAAESMLEPMKKYCDDNGISSLEDKASIAEQYYAFVGMGKVKLDIAGGSATMTNAHVDEGWIKKWGKRDKAVNFIGQGFLLAAFALANGATPTSYNVVETQSIVSGAATSEFTISTI